MIRQLLKLVFLVSSLFSSYLVYSHSLVDTVSRIKPSVVGIGIYDPLNSPRASLHGTGFVVANGQYIITNHHVITVELDDSKKQKRVIFVGSGSNPKTIQGQVIEVDALHDLALIKIAETLPPLTLAGEEYIADGSEILFTGFPIGAILGLFPATHRGIVAATTPVILPANNARQLDINAIKRLRDPYMIYQLDATAYPGNSGSAVYDSTTGEVIGVINKGFIKSTKEAVLSDPSGITYAIPVKYVHEILNKAGVSI